MKMTDIGEIWKGQRMVCAFTLTEEGDGEREGREEWMIAGEGERERKVVVDWWVRKTDL